MSVDLGKLITENEPVMTMWKGDYANPTSSTKYEHGIYNCGFGPCKTAGSTDSNQFNGMWVPPNQYVYLWDDYQNKGPYPLNPKNERHGSQSWYEKNPATGNNDTGDWKPLCQTSGEVMTKLYGALYKDVDGACSATDLMGTDKMKYMIGQGAAQFPDPNDMFGDPCPGREKKIEMEYDCGVADEFSSYDRPNGVYNPGFYNSLSDSSIGSYKGVQIPEGVNKSDRAKNVDTILVRRIKPWKDHLRDCCFGEVTDYDKCGIYGRKNKDGRSNTDQGNACKDLFINECSADDIKIANGDVPEGKCAYICQSNPRYCDNIKNNYCKTNPTSPWCDCINAASRTEFQEREAVLKRKGIRTPYRVCMSGRCVAGEDLTNIFLTSDDINYRLKEMGQCPPPSVYQEVNVQGTGNTVSTDMSAQLTTERSDTTPRPNSGSGGSSAQPGLSSSIDQGAEVKGNNNILDAIMRSINTSSNNNGSDTGTNSGVLSTTAKWGIAFIFTIICIIAGFFLIGGKKKSKKSKNKSNDVAVTEEVENKNAADEDKDD
jgi:hypothetical protein